MTPAIKDQPKHYRPPVPYAAAFNTDDFHAYLNAASSLASHAADEAAELAQHPSGASCPRQCEALDLACIYALATYELRTRDLVQEPQAMLAFAAYNMLQRARATSYNALLTLRPAVQLRAAASGPCYARWSASQRRRGRLITAPVRAAIGEVLEAAFRAVVAAGPDGPPDPRLPSI